MGVDDGAEPADLLGQLGVRPGRLAQPEGDRGVGALGVDHPHHAGLDPADAPGVGAEEEHVAGHGLDGPVLVDRADEGVVGVGHDPVVGQPRGWPRRW